VDFYTDIRAGDEIRIVAEQVFVGDQFLDFDRVMAIEYAGKARHQVAFLYDHRTATGTTTTPPGTR